MLKILTYFLIKVETVNKKLITFKNVKESLEKVNITTLS